MRADANQLVSHLVIGMDENLEVGTLVTGVNVGVVRISDNVVLEHVHVNQTAIVQKNENSPIPSPRVIAIPIQKSWSEEVMFMLGARGMKWNVRASGMTDLTFGGSHGMPAVGSTLRYAPNTKNYIGQVMIYGQEVELKRLLDQALQEEPNPYLVGEYKVLAFDGGDSVEIKERTWLKCDGRTLPKADYPELFNALGTSFGGSGNQFNLPHLTGKVLAMADEAGGDRLGTGVGSKNQTLAVEHLPPHQHSYRDSTLALAGNASDSGNIQDGYLVEGAGSSMLKQTEPSGNANPTPISLYQPTLFGGYYYICAK